MEQMTEKKLHRRDCMKAMGAMALMSLAGAGESAAQDAIGADTVYELRMYHLNEGKLPLILDRFRSRETAIFARCGMHGVAYWVPAEEPLAGRTIVYMLRHNSRAAATESWAKFNADPEWVSLKAASEKDGPFVKLHESTFLKLTDFSPRL